MNDVFRSRYLNIPFKIIDCNTCKHINMTEREQRVTTKKQLHICQYYHCILKHRTNKPFHNSYIYPCDKCALDNYLHYQARECKPADN